MGTPLVQGDRYRLVITFEDQRSVADPFCFERFEQAQARVSRAVRRYAPTGRIVAIALQRGRPVAPIVPISPGRVNLGHPDAYQWVTEKRWGSDVISRIVAQQRNSAAATTPIRANVATAGASAAASTGAVAVPAGEHPRPARWHVGGVLALVCGAILLALLYQTGGNPRFLLAITHRDAQPIKHELPFDAHAVLEGSGRAAGPGSAPAPRVCDEPSP